MAQNPNARVANAPLPPATNNNNNNEEVCSFVVTKHSWRGKYARIFTIGTECVSTQNPATLEATNQWTYADFLSIKPVLKAGALVGEFVISMRQRNTKVDTMRFSSDFTPTILSAALQFRSKFGGGGGGDQSASGRRLQVNAYKQHWSDERVPVMLLVGDAALTQLNNKLTVVAQYMYKDIVELVPISDLPGGFCVVYGQEERRLHIFATAGRDELMQQCNSVATENLGIGVKISRHTATIAQCAASRLGRYGSTDQQLTSFVEFTVHKISPRHTAPIRRLLCLSETCLLERDPATYACINVRPLLRVHCLVRHLDNPQRFDVEFDSDLVRTYEANLRDTVLASLLDGVRAAGNSDVHVKCTRAFDRGQRFVPYRQYLDEDAESHVCRLLVTPPAHRKYAYMIRRFNANIPYSGLLYSTTQEGLFSENKERLIVNCIQSVMAESNQVPVDEMEAQLHCLRRLFASKAGFHAFTNVIGLREKLGEKVVAALRRQHETINHAALDMLCALMQPMHSNYELRQEQMNKNALLASESFLEHLLEMGVAHMASDTGALVIASLLDLLTYALCAPYSETTAGDRFDTLLNMVASRGRVFYRLFQHPCTTIVKGAGMVMRAIIEESDETTSRRMQALALSDGALLRHLHTAVFTQSKDVRLLTQRQLSRHLLSLWCAGNVQAHQLLQRCLPKGLLNLLLSSTLPPVNDEDMLLVRNNLHMAETESGQPSTVIAQQLADVQKKLEKQMDQLLNHWRLHDTYNVFKKDERHQRPVTLRKRRQRIQCTDNWRLFFYEFARDHSRCDLIWNHKTREELREAIDTELRLLAMDVELASGHQGKVKHTSDSTGATAAPPTVPVSWNHVEFEVAYPSLADEVRIGDYFLRNLLDEDTEENNKSATLIHQPLIFFNDVYHHYLLTTKVDMRCLCLRAMAITYARHAVDIGQFNDLPHLLSMLQKCTTPRERDHLIALLARLLVDTSNVRLLINAGGLHVLLDLLPLAHLHTQRALAPAQGNALEAGDESTYDCAEWYYTDTDAQQRHGPVTLAQLRELYTSGSINETTKCWASGLDNWRQMQHIAQLRWTLLLTPSTATNEDDVPVAQPNAHGLWTLSELCAHILDMFIQMCTAFPSRDADNCCVRPIPRVKRFLSVPVNLPHIVQLLLTFDAAIVERTAVLLALVMQDNPYTSRLYLTGMFYFILMYAGSNVLSIARLLHETHLMQAVKSAENTSVSSVLMPLLPDACVHYLRNHGAESYARVFLGEYDNPEVIWNNTMRRHMITRIAAHVADFSVRLKTNVRAIYQYCPIPAIQYDQLEDELFCHIYYLRHLCDTKRFADWPIQDPVALLKACLQAWHDEINRKPSNFSLKDACEVLGVDIANAEDESALRKAYFKLAQKYHPDKNPEGREMFEKVNAAYELLGNRSQRSKSQGPDPHRIYLCLKAQSVVYSRNMNDLAPYKYAGYSQLIKTIQMETTDDTLFSKSAPLLAGAMELCYYTLACSPLNAEQLRRDDGLEAQALAFDRCASVLSASTRGSDLAAAVCMHACRCLATAAQFDACRQRLVAMPNVFDNVVRVLRYAHVPEMATAAAECVRSLSVCVLLQTRLFQSGALWQLLPNLFTYDATLAVTSEQPTTDGAQTASTQALANQLARVSCEASAAMCGYMDECPEHDGVQVRLCLRIFCTCGGHTQNALCALLTRYVVRCMRDRDPPDRILQLLNANVETPYMIWNNATRAEMLQYVEKQRHPTTATSELFGADFCLSILNDELIVGDVYVRVYNQQPSFVLTQPKQFAADLLEYLSVPAVRSCLYNQSIYQNGVDVAHDDATNKCRTSRLIGAEHTRAALRALLNVMKANPGVELLCIGHFTMLFAYLNVDEVHVDVQTVVLEVISCAAGNHECVGDMASSGCVVQLLQLTRRRRVVHLTIALATLFTLASHPKCVKDALDSGGLIYLLDIFCNDDSIDLRCAAAEVIGKMQSDKLTGPRWSRAIVQYVPAVFADACRDSSRTAVNLFDTNTENPELIWNDEARELVKIGVRMERDKMSEVASTAVNQWKPPSTPLYNAGNAQHTDAQLIIGGVYVRVFVQQPQWTLRAPRHFLTELVERLIAEMRRSTGEQDAELLEVLTQAFCALLQYHAGLSDQMAALGYVPQLVEVMRTVGASNANTGRALLLSLYHICRSDACVDQLSQVDCLTSMIATMRTRPDLLHSAAQTLVAMFSFDRTHFIQQALNAKLVEYLLSLLGSPLRDVTNASAVKAEIVDVLKAMTRNLELGVKVQAQLDASKVWKEFKDQRHDLFLARAPELPSLMAGSATAGYLTSGGAQLGPQIVPPPMPAPAGKDELR